MLEVEHIVEAMQHGYVQYSSRPGGAGVRNYRRRELQLLSGISDDEESRASGSERDREEPLSDGDPDQEVRLREGEMAGGGPGQDGLNET